MRESRTYGSGGNPLQLLFNLGTTLNKHFVNPLSQVHKCFNAYP
jgi:hypothetical protein